MFSDINAAKDFLVSPKEILETTIENAINIARIRKILAETDYLPKLLDIVGQECFLTSQPFQLFKDFLLQTRLMAETHFKFEVFLFEFCVFFHIIFKV